MLVHLLSLFTVETPMSVPQTISDAVTALQQSADELASAKTDASTKTAAAVQAQHDADGANSNVAQLAAKEASALDSLKKLLDQTYGVS